MSCRVYILLLLALLDTLQVACDQNCTRLFHCRMLYNTYVFTSFLLEVKSYVCLFLFSSTALHNLKMCCITFFSGFYVSTLFFSPIILSHVLYIQLTSQMLYAQVYTDTACYCNAIPNYRQRYLTFSIFQCTKVFKRNFSQEFVKHDLKSEY